MTSSHARFYWRKLGRVQRVLDLGCAAGDLAKHGPQGVQVFGIDLNLRMLAEAKSYELVQAWDLEGPTLPFPTAFFDAVVAKDILEHLPKPWKTLKEIHRILKPGGRVIGSTITPRGHRVWSDYTHVRGFTTAALRQMFIDSGFDVERIWRMGGVPGTGRFDAIGMVPYLLRVPPLDWCWTSSYEILARREP